MATPYHRLTQEDKHRIIQAFHSGEECRNIPVILQVSDRAVSRVLLEAGINTKRRNRYALNEHYFDEIDSDIKAYLLGLIAADGCVTQTNYVAFESIDRELTELLKAELQYSGEMKVIQPKGGYAPHYRINFSSQLLARALASKGVIAGRGFSGIYYFPPEPYFTAYVLGYFDGDGCAYVNPHRSGGSVSIVGSFEFAAELTRLIKIGVVRKHYLKPVSYWKIYSRKDIQTFYQLVYKNPILG